jgi:aspartate aminotransferase-like enzyme
MLITEEPDKLLLIPGPTPVERTILAALSVPTISHTSAPMAEIVSACLDGLRFIAETREAQPFVFGGSGTLAQEAAVVNLVAPGERLLIASNGFFGDRFAPIARAHGIEVEHLKARWGESVTPGQLEHALARTACRAIAITQVETSTGTLAPVEALAAEARQHGALVIVDAVCAFAGTPTLMDAWGIDVLVTGAQKALGMPPGLSILLASPAALARRRQMPAIASYYADLLNWLPSMEDPTVYFSTHAVNLFYALRAALELIRNEGLERRFARHDLQARAFRAGAEALGFRPLTDPRHLAPTLSVLRYPEDISDEEFRAELSRRGVVAAACLGEFNGIGVRFGHMGNIGDAEIVQALWGMESTLRALNVRIKSGAGVAAAQAQLSDVSSTVPRLGIATVR